MSKTFITTYRGSITDIATIARWLVANGIKPRSKVELLNVAIENFVKNLNENFPELTVLDERDALTYLSELGLLEKGLTKMQPALSKSFWKSSLNTGTSLSSEEELSKKNIAAGANKLAIETIKLMENAEKREERDKTQVKNLGQPTNLIIVEN